MKKRPPTIEELKQKIERMRIRQVKRDALRPWKLHQETNQTRGLF